MSSSSSLDCLELCRLCLEKERVSVPIFENEGDVRQIFLKITACLPVKVSRDDKLPKKICDDCLYKVELFYQFWNTTANAEKQLLQWLGEVGGLEDGVPEVLVSNVMKQEQASDSRLEGRVVQVGGQNSVDMGMIENMTIITMPVDGEQQFASVPMDTSGTVTVQAVASSSASANDQSQTSVSHLADEVEDDDDDDDDDGCDNEGMPVKEENEEDQSDRVLDQSSFVTIPCDEAGPSGLQQKIADISNMSLQPTEVNDPKTGPKRERTRIPSILQRKPKPKLSKDVKQIINTNATRSVNSDVRINILGTINNHQVIIYHPPQNSINRATDNSIVIVSSDEEDTNTGDFRLEFHSEDGEVIHRDEGEDQLNEEVIETESPTVNMIAYECDSCHENFPDSSSLIIHKTERSIARTRAALREPIAIHTCKMCRARFTSKPNYIRHINNCGLVDMNALPESCKQIRKPRIIYPKKEKKTNETDGQRETSEKIHFEGENQIAPCTQCNKVFKKDKYLKVHMIAAHGELLVCQICGEKFNSSNKLRKHITSIHDELNEPCTTCGKVFYSRQSLKVHMAAHKRDTKLLPCNQCDRSFRHESYLQKHIQSFHVEKKGRKTYHCEECGYESVYKACFREHMAKHTGEDQVTCDICSKKMRKGYMKLHMRIHSGERPEICEYCGKGFAARKYLKKHIVVHTGEKPHTCHVCGKSYTQTGTLTLHLRKHHPNELEPAERRYPWRFVGKNKRPHRQQVESVSEVEKSAEGQNDGVTLEDSKSSIKKVDDENMEKNFEEVEMVEEEVVEEEEMAEGEEMVEDEEEEFFEEKVTIL